MLKVNETIRVRSINKILTTEAGVLEIIVPTGDVLRVVCRPGHDPAVRHVKFSPELKRKDLTWQVTKLSDNPESDSQMIGNQGSCRDGINRDS